MREALEVANARHAALDRSEETLARLARSVEFQRLSIADTDKEDFHRADEEIREIIMATTQVARLPVAVRSVSQHVDRARVLMIPQPGRLAETLSEHTSILAAIRDQDEIRTKNAMRHHLGQLTERLFPLEAERPDLFAT